MSPPVVTSQPEPPAPLDENEAIADEPAPEKNTSSAPPIESVVVTQPVNSEVSEKPMYAQTEALQVEEKRRLQRNQDFCCFACAESSADDTWCWYIICRMYCLEIRCESCANCLEFWGEGCVDCLQDCCVTDQGGCDGCCSGINDESYSGGIGDCGGCFD